MFTLATWVAIFNALVVKFQNKLKGSPSSRRGWLPGCPLIERPQLGTAPPLSPLCMYGCRLHGCIS